MKKYFLAFIFLAQTLAAQDTSGVYASDISLFTLRIYDISTPSDDQLTLSIIGTNLIVHDPNNQIIGDGTAINPNTRSYPLADFDSILIQTRTGSDSVTINAPLSFSAGSGMHIEGSTTVMQNASMTLTNGTLSMQVSHSINFTENAQISCSNTATIELITQSDINFKGSIQNHATSPNRNITFIAGWGGVLPVVLSDYNDYSTQASLTSSTPFGNNNGSIYIGDGNQTAPVHVGNRYGTVNLYAHDILLDAGSTASNRYAQIGYRSTNRGNGFLIPGHINLRAKRDIVLQSGNNNTFNYTQIGHVGGDQTVNNILEAQVNAPIYFGAGNLISINGGSSLHNYSQLGHGGIQTLGNFTGSLHLLSTKTRLILNDNDNNGYSRFGHDE